MCARPRFRYALTAVVLSAAFAVVCPSPSIAASAEPNYSGLWWNSPPESESGWGVNLSHQGDTIFATWFTYDASGNAWWLSTTTRKTPSGTYTGTLLETRGPPFSSVPFDKSKVTRTPVGVATLTFVDVDTGTLRYTVNGVSGTKFVTRQAFDLLPTCTYAAQPDLASATNYTDLWWIADGAESGWGINLMHEADTIFATWFTYDANGAPMWVSVTAPKVSQGVYRGQLIRTRGPAFAADPFDPSKVTRTVVGAATFTFANGNSARFDYALDGVVQSKTITRQLFVPPAGTACGAPARALTSVQAVVAADIGQCFGLPAAGSGAARTASLVTAQDVLVLTGGDNTYDYGTPEEFANCFDPTWGRFKSRIHPTIGNHEYYTTGANGYFEYFGAQAGPDRLGYYSFDTGGWHVISLNAVAEVTPTSAQYRWLEADLAKSADALCTIALLHYPTFNSGAGYGSVVAMRPIFDLLQSAGVEAIFAGHEHLYERFAPQRGDGTVDPARGLRQFTVGTGGHALNPFGAPLPNSEFRYNASWAILRIVLAQGTYSWKLVPVDGGAALDAGSATCHR